MRRSYDHSTGKFTIGTISFEISERIEEQIKNGTLRHTEQRHTEQIRQSYPFALPATLCRRGLIAPLIFHSRASWK
jgi:hypothetical protein